MDLQSSFISNIDNSSNIEENSTIINNESEGSNT
jgi:hypothetical protein